MKRAPQKRKREGDRRTDPTLRRQYFTARWSKIRAIVLARDNHLCQECVRNGKTEAGNEIDHIRKARTNRELFWSLDNLQTLCHKCHNAKTARGE